MKIIHQLIYFGYKLKQKKFRIENFILNYNNIENPDNTI